MKNNMPDAFYYQTNGKSATENYIEQKKAIKDKLLSEESESFEINLTSEVSKK